MLYQTLRAAARVALHWYYSDVIVQGRDRIPSRGPLLVVANHPNALVDALLVVATVDRRVLLTAKATLFEHTVLAWFLGVVGVVPLRRARDERRAVQQNVPVARNADAFRMVTHAFQNERVVLVFPEGISHDEPSLAPLKSGAARMALQAREAGARGLHVLPIGLVYEEKERPRSRILVRIGEPVDIDAWCTANSSNDVSTLTREIDARLRQVTLNFASAERASRAVRVARALVAMAEEAPSLGDNRAFVFEAELAARVELATEALDSAPVSLVCAADAFTTRLDALEARLIARGATLANSRISLRIEHGTRFVLREGAVSVLALPIAALGRLAHWLPIHIARAVALHSTRADSSRDQPAMRTIIFGMSALLLWYALQAVLITRWRGGIVAAFWLIAIFVAAQVNLRLEDRVLRAWKRAKTYLVLRGDSELRASVLAEIDALLEEAIALEQALTHGAREVSL